MNLFKRAIASRAKGATSRGPKTEEATRRSSQNAIRHGLLAKCIVLHNESEEVFQPISRSVNSTQPTMSNMTLSRKWFPLTGASTVSTSARSITSSCSAPWIPRTS
jgi:hypothetical protein